MQYEEFYREINLNNMDPYGLSEQFDPQNPSKLSDSLQSIIPHWKEAERTIFNPIRQGSKSLDAGTDQYNHLAYLNFIQDFTERQSIAFVNRNDFSGSFAYIGNFFSSTNRVLEKAPGAYAYAVEIINKLHRHLPIEKIARELGADSYSISIFPTAIALNFPVSNPKPLPTGA